MTVNLATTETGTERQYFLISRVTEAFQLKFPIQILFQFPTVRDMSAAIVKNQMDEGDQKATGKILSALEELMDEQVHRLLSQER